MASTTRLLSSCLPAKSFVSAGSRQRTARCSHQPFVPIASRVKSVATFQTGLRGPLWISKCSFQTLAGGAKHGRSTVMAAAAASNQIGEQVMEQDAIAEAMERVQEHQKTAAQITPVVEARTILDICRQGVLSVHSSKHEGYPMGSLVGYASDEAGSPILAISDLSPHTKDLRTNPRCSLFLSRDLNSTYRAKVTLLGDAEFVDGSERQSLRDAYLKKHPNAFYVDFGDFHFVRIRPTVARLARNIASFAAGASVSHFTPEEFAAAEPDPISPVEKPIMEHMNADHADALMATVEHYVGTPKLNAAQMLEVDQLGMRVQVTQGGSSFALRVPFTRPAKDRGDVKTLLVEMTRESMKALNKSRGAGS